MQRGCSGRTEFALEIGEHAVRVRGGNCDRHPQDDPRQELLRLSAYESRHDRSVERGDVEGEDRSKDEEERVEKQERSFLAMDGGNDDTKESTETLEEESVDLSAKE